MVPACTGAISSFALLFATCHSFLCSVLVNPIQLTSWVAQVSLGSFKPYDVFNTDAVHGIGPKNTEETSSCTGHLQFVGISPSNPHSQGSSLCLGTWGLLSFVEGDVGESYL